MKRKSRSPAPRTTTDPAKPAAETHESRAFETLLKSDPELLRSLIDQAADAVCLHEINGRILDVNRRMCTTLGYSREELLSLSVFDVDVTATRQETEQATRALTPGLPITTERVLRRTDGSTLPIELSLSLIVSGDKQLMLGIARDITDRKRAELAQELAQRALEKGVRERTEHLETVNRRLEEEMRARERSEAHLRESEQRFRELAERGDLLAWEADARTWHFSYVGPQARDLLGYPVTDWYQADFWAIHIHPEDRERTLDFCRRQSAAKNDYEFEYRMLAADGSYVWFHDIVHVVSDDNGPRTLRGFMIDITARKRAEETQKLLLRELDHRVKNTLATVQAVAELTLQSSDSLEGFAETFRKRIAALARMHAAIWRNKGTPIQLRELVALALAPFGRESERASLAGDEVSIPVQSAGPMGLVLHELATNAVKHGALSVASGRVRVSWRFDDGRLYLNWRESGGPRVVPPIRRGFGSVLIERSIPYELDGSATLHFASDGVECTITCPLTPS